MSCQRESRHLLNGKDNNFWQTKKFYPFYFTLLHT